MTDAGLPRSRSRFWLKQPNKEKFFFILIDAVCFPPVLSHPLARFFCLKTFFMLADCFFFCPLLLTFRFPFHPCFLSFHSRVFHFIFFSVLVSAPLSCGNAGIADKIKNKRESRRRIFMEASLDKNNHSCPTKHKINVSSGTKLTERT